MNRVTMIADYMSVELAKIESDQLYAEAQYEQYCARLYILTTNKNKQKTIESDPTAVNLSEKLNLITAKAKILKALVDSRDRQYRALSRDQTRRQHTWEKKKSY